ncbi:TIGR00153 family protein [Thermococcus chitonophagus]|uniref:Phosphate transport regulator (Distant homolog of PhoU) n=1 Tax=Thermococcus chitonophagus TaxID=54262 RepID=A0A160VRL1_9EURY|nr:TIGR00153 family protein [Thermococcus chitonophagus]ASJ16665.1 TIGR00153 family protein [Thermococcus chitonophagus]CUX77410.1 Phosphate transport regulator (distant homolog of PhoU) [Thermococcus chitonophagus]
MQVWTKLFAKSPFKPLIKHAEVVVQTVETLEKALDLWAQGNYEEMKKYAIEVDRLEDVADRIKMELRNSVTSKLLMPVQRTDILEYLHMQDKVADAAEDTAKWLLVKKEINVPQEVKDLILKMGRESIKAAKLVYEAIRQMDTVVESGFSDAEIEKEYEIIKQIEDVESKIDGLDTKLMELVLNNNLSWADGLYILNIARTLSNISDKAKDAAERIRIMMNK